MSVYLTGRAWKFVGLAADIKPVSGVASTAQRIPPGSQFQELDTNKTYVWSSTGWIEFKLAVTTS